MKFSIVREEFLKPLQAVQGVVERRQSLPILANFLVVVTEDSLSLTATDMELEMVARTGLDGAEPGEITVPARKLVDICRSLPPEAPITVALEGERIVLRSGRSRFTLSPLPAGDYPSADVLTDEQRCTLPQSDLRRLIELTQFAMAQQDVRYYLNGLLMELSSTGLRAVATDGHRLAVADQEMEIEGISEPRSIIIPRKGITELARLLGTGDEMLELTLGTSAIQIGLGDIRFTSKLIDGKFPDYDRVIPDQEDCDKQISVDRELLRQSLHRAAILSNDKYRAIRLSLGDNTLKLVANNPEHEEAEDAVEVEYSGDNLEIGFNVSYLIDALTVIPGETARLFLKDSGSSCLLTPETGEACRYVVMPMRL